MPEETYVDLPDATFEAAVVYGPDEPGYFTKDGWYAVRIYTITEKLYTSRDGDEAWIKDGKPNVEKIIIGTEVDQYDPSISGPEFNILRSNISANGMAVRTRVGNFQFRSDWDRVVVP